MPWEIAVIWTVVAATLIWFVRDEQRVRRERLEAQARYFAVAPAYRYQSSIDPEHLRRQFTGAMRKR